MQLRANKSLLFLGLGSAICLFGIYACWSDSFILSLIPQHKEGLLEIAKVVDLDGTGARKLVNDVLWFPIQNGDAIFLADSLRTDTGSSLIVEFESFAKSRIHINGGTQIKILSALNKPLIQLSRGQISLDSTIGEEILLSTGLHIQPLLIKPGIRVRILAREEGAIEVHYEKTKVADTLTKQNSTPAPVAAAKTEAPKSQPESSTPIGPADFGKQERPLKFPYPENETVFLNHGGMGKVSVFPSLKCSGKCKLRIVANGVTPVLEKEFAMDEEPFVTISYNQKTDLAYSWFLDEDGKRQTGVFYVRPFSASLMQHQLERNMPIVILSDL